jgi:hypothetical protein
VRARALPVADLRRGAQRRRADLSIDDVMRFYIIGVTSAPFDSDDQRERILDVAIAGIAASAAGRLGAQAT